MDPDHEFAIEIKPSSFSWGIRSQKDEEDEKKDKDKGKGNTYAKKAGKRQKLVQQHDKLMDTEIKLSDVITLKDIKLKVKPGQLVCIIGDVGSGKSSLINALLGDLLYVDQNLL